MSIRILVADDFAPWRVQTRKLLQAHSDWQLMEACDGQEAVQKATELRPHIVLLDVGMPIRNGLDAADKIREVMPQSKTIFVTQNGDAEVKAAALATGAKAYISKATAPSELLPAIETVLHEHQF